MASREKVLVVDDAPEILLLMKRVLEKEGISMVKATNGIEAIHALQESADIRLVFIDAMMPHMDGYQAVEYMKKEFPDRELKICFLTSQRSPASVKKAVSLGADDYLVKPIDVSLVLKKCNDLLGNSSALSGFASADVEIPVTIPGLPIITELKMVKLSEIGAELESNVLFKKNVVIDLYANKMPESLSEIEEFQIRFKIKEVVDWSGGYTVEGVFVGLNEKMAKHFRALAIKGPSTKSAAA